MAGVPRIFPFPVRSQAAIDVANRVLLDGSNADAGFRDAIDAAAKFFDLDYVDAVERTIEDHLNEQPVFVANFSDKVVPHPTDPTKDNWSPAINAALASKFTVRIPEGRYYIGDPLVFASAGNFIVGDGPAKTIFVIDEDFSDFAATGIVTIPDTASENHAGMHNIGFEFGQPGGVGVTRADFIQYPWAVSARNVARMCYGRVRLTGAWDGFDFTDNTGGLLVQCLEIGAINRGVIGGDALGRSPALDFWHVDTFHFWPFGFQDANRYPIYRDGQTIGGIFGRIDGFNVKDFSSFSSRIAFSAAVSEGPFGIIGGMQLDGRYSRLEFNAGRVAIGGFYGTTDIAGDFKIKVTAGHLNVGAWWAATSATTGTTPLFECVGAYLGMPNGLCANTNPGAPVFSVSSGGELIVSGNNFLGLVNTTRTAPVIEQLDTATLIAYGNKFQTIGTGSGNAIKINTDVATNLISNNVYTGWNLSLPTEPTAGYVGSYGQVYNRIRTIAAVDPLPIRASDQTLEITGNTTFGTLQTTYPGHRLLFRFKGSPIVNNNPGNVVYYGGQSFQASPDLAIDMLMTDAGWKEVSRSIPSSTNFWAVTTPAVTAEVGSLTGTATLRLRRDEYGQIHFNLSIAVSNIGTSANGWKVDLPFGVEYTEIFSGANITNGAVVQARIAAGTSTLYVYKYDNSAPGTTGDTVVVCGTYRGDV